LLPKFAFPWSQGLQLQIDAERAPEVYNGKVVEAFVFVNGKSILLVINSSNINVRIEVHRTAFGGNIVLFYT
jgi:hypothetical protein